MLKTASVSVRRCFGAVSIATNQSSISVFTYLSFIYLFYKSSGSCGCQADAGEHVSGATRDVFSRGNFLSFPPKHADVTPGHVMKPRMSSLSYQHAFLIIFNLIMMTGYHDNSLRGPVAHFCFSLSPTLLPLLAIIFVVTPPPPPHPSLTAPADFTPIVRKTISFVFFVLVFFA